MYNLRREISTHSHLFARQGGVHMLTIDEYIAKMKKADKLNEFDYLKVSDNMSSVMKYVMSYFNEYLTMETCDAEEIKFKHAIDKLQQEVMDRYPQSKEFVLNFYLRHRIRLDKELDKWVNDIPYFPFFYSDADFLSLADGFCSSYKISNDNMAEYQDNVAILISEIKQYQTDAPRPVEMLHLDNNIVAWVRDTYRQYGVNLYAFASDLAYLHYQRYVKYERGNYGETGYYVNYYNHRYNKNPFGVDQIYEDNKHRPFLDSKRGEFEMLIMHEWLFSMVYDDDYWSEYVNLCIAHGRVSIAKNVNVLIPVTTSGLSYPKDAPCSTEHIVSLDGILKKAPQASYIFRVDLTQTHAGAWQNTEEMASLITSLSKSFKEYGAPRVLELAAPIKTASFNEEMFFSCCSALEKKMKKFSPMKIAIVNGSGNQKAKPPSYICRIEDIIQCKAQLRARKIHIQFSIDFSALMAIKRDTSYTGNALFGPLTEIKNSIICLNVTNVTPQLHHGPKMRIIGNDTDVYCLNKYRYPTYDDFYTMLSSTFNDNQQRYLIPKNIASNEELEALVDNLLRSGFSFGEVGDQNG